MERRSRRRARRLVHGRADERVPEDDLVAVDPDESCAFGGVEGVRRQAELRSRVQDLPVAEIVAGRGQRDGALGPLGQRGDVGQEHPFDPRGEADRLEPDRGAGVGRHRATSGRRGGGAELRQRERVALGLGDHVVALPHAQLGGDAGEDAACVVPAERLDPELLGERRGVVGVGRDGARRGEERDRGVPEPARDEGDDGRAGGIEPVQVLDDDEQRPARGRLLEEAQGRHADHQGVGGRPVLEAERDPERGPLTLGEPPQEVQHGVEELVQAREADALGGCSAVAEEGLQPRVPGDPAGEPGQRRLAHPGLADEQQRAARGARRGADQPRQGGDLLVSSDQARGILRHETSVQAGGVSGPG